MKKEITPEISEIKESYNFIDIGNKGIYCLVHSMSEENLELYEYRMLWDTIFNHLLKTHFSMFVKREDKVALGIILRAATAGLLSAKKLLLNKNIPVFYIWTARREGNDKNEIEADMLNCNLPKEAPRDLKIVILEPVCASGKSTKETMRHLKRHNALEENITFLFGVAPYEGLLNLFEDYPKINITVAYTGNHIGLNEKSYIVYKDTKKLVVGDVGDLWTGITGDGKLVY